MAIPTVIRAENLGKTMNEIRTWLDAEGVEPTDFKTVVGHSGLGFEISFRSEHEAERFQERFASLALSGELAGGGSASRQTRSKSFGSY